MQRKMLIEAGVDAMAIYDDAEQSLDTLIKALRVGDTVAVTTAGRLASDRATFKRAEAAIRARRAAILETTTGRRSDNPADIAAMVLAAVDEIASHGKVHGPKAAKEYGSRGGKARAEKIEQARTPKHIAEREWFNVRNRTIDEALATEGMKGWSQQMAYRAFKGRGVSVGRPRKRSKT